MKPYPFLPVCLLMNGPMPAQAGEWQAGLSFIPLLLETPALHLNYRPAHSHFQLGYTWQRWSINLMDNLTHVRTTEITHTRYGPGVVYRMDGEAAASWYVGVELLQWNGQEHALTATGTSARSSSRNIYFGGGYTGHFSEMNSLYYSFGLYLAPGAHLTTPAMGGSSSGSFDLHMQIGLHF